MIEGLEIPVGVDLIMIGNLSSDHPEPNNGSNYSYWNRPVNHRS